MMAGTPPPTEPASGYPMPAGVQEFPRAGTCVECKHEEIAASGFSLNRCSSCRLTRCVYALRPLLPADNEHRYCRYVIQYTLERGSAHLLTYSVSFQRKDWPRHKKVDHELALYLHDYLIWADQVCKVIKSIGWATSPASKATLPVPPS